MSNYFQAVKKNDVAVVEALDYFNKEYEEAKQEINIKGRNLTECCSTLSSYYEKRLAQYQEIVAILKHFEIKLNSVRAAVYKHFLESYQRELSSPDIKIYVDGDEKVVALQQVINEIVFVKNKFTKEL